MAAMYRRRRHAELNSQASTQGCNTFRLRYAHSYRGSAEFITQPAWTFSDSSSRHILPSILFLLKFRTYLVGAIVPNTPYLGPFLADRVFCTIAPTRLNIQVVLIPESSDYFPFVCDPS